MIYQLSNGKIKIKADSVGAELKSIKLADDKEGYEYLWQLNPKVWERQAPLLFPIIGRLKDEEYTFGDKSFSTRIHGFARFMDFNVNTNGMDEIRFTLESNEMTKREYPFDFSLTIAYKLDGFSIIKEHIVSNEGKGVMYYEVGGHEGYNLAAGDDLEMEDCFIEFPGTSTLCTFRGDADMMIAKERETVNLTDNKLYLSPEVFKRDALIMDEIKERKVILDCGNGNRKITVEFDDFKYLGVWTKYMRGNYVCIEPWSSLPDCNFIGKELVNKIDIRKLEQGESEMLMYKITME